MDISFASCAINAERLASTLLDGGTFRFRATMAAQLWQNALVKQKIMTWSSARQLSLILHGGGEIRRRIEDDNHPLCPSVCFIRQAAPFSSGEQGTDRVRDNLSNGRLVQSAQFRVVYPVATAKTSEITKSNEGYWWLRARWTRLSWMGRDPVQHTALLHAHKTSIHAF